MRHAPKILFLILMTTVLTTMCGCGGSGSSGNSKDTGSLTGSGK